KPSFPDSCQAAEQQAHAGEIDKRLTVGGKPFVVAAETPGTAQPSEGALDHPAPRQHMKAGLKAHLVQQVWEIALEVTPPGIDHCELDAQVLAGPLAQRARVSLIRPDKVQPRKIR